MVTLYMMKGLPASGKSTRAKAMLAELGYGNAKRINKDELRAMLDDGHWSGQNEKFLLSVRDHVVAAALAAKKHVIVDDTNLAPKHEEAMRLAAKAAGAAFEVVDFTAVTVDECISRDRKRAAFVGESVIRDMYDKFLAPTPPERPAIDGLSSVQIVDVDGTVAQMNGRGPFEWSRVGEDLPRLSVIRAILSYGEKWVFVSGRDESCRTETTAWLQKYFGSAEPLHMRPAGDMRKDVIVKREIFEREIEGRFNVAAIWDDRPQVIRLWQELGFGDRIFNVGDGKEF